MNRLVIYTLVAAALVLALRFLVAYLEPRLAFYPFPGVQETPQTLGIPYRDVWLQTSDGERLSSWWIEPPNPRGDVVYFHGNGGNLSNWLPVVADMHARGLAVLAIDYRGYGASTGSPTEQGLYRDTDAAVAVFWRDLHRGGRPVVYWGRSLGSVAAAYATTVREPDALILESPFPDKASAIAGNLVFRMLNVFGSYRFPTSEWLSRYSRPSLVVHGDADTIIGYQLGKRVFDALREPKTFVTIRGADHNDLHLVDPDSYWRAIDSFLSSLHPRRQ